MDEEDFGAGMEDAGWVKGVVLEMVDLAGIDGTAAGGELVVIRRTGTSKKGCIGGLL